MCSEAEKEQAAFDMLREYVKDRACFLTKEYASYSSDILKISYNATIVNGVSFKGACAMGLLSPEEAVLAVIAKDQEANKDATTTT